MFIRFFYTIQSSIVCFHLVLLFIFCSVIGCKENKPNQDPPTRVNSTVDEILTDAMPNLNLIPDFTTDADVDILDWGQKTDVMIEDFSIHHRQDEFYEKTSIQDIELIIDLADRQAMFNALPELIYVPATFRWRDIELDHVAVRFKGNSSSPPEAWWKRSLLIKFGEFVDGQRFMGLRRIALDNAVQFGSIFSERLITDILQAEGVHCSRTNYARVKINGQYEGVFVNVERIDKSFLERVFLNRDGVLYKNHLGGPGSELTVLNTAKEYAASFEAKTHKDKADYSEIYELALLLRDTPQDQLLAVLEDQLNLDPFLKIMAVMVFSGAFDQYTGFNPHNFYLYRNPTTGRMNYLVWDLDVGFADMAFGRVPVIDAWNASWPLPRTPRPLLERILSHDVLRNRYLVHADRILETYFTPSILGDQLDLLFTQVQASLQNDPYPPRRVTSQSDEDYESIVSSMKAFMQRRYLTARAQLDQPITEAPMQNNEEDPSPGLPGPDDPSDLRLDRIDDRGVHLSWIDHSEREAITVLQRCEGIACDQFENWIGIPSSQPPYVVDPNTRSGQTYRYRVYAAWPTPTGPQGSGTSNIVDVSIP